MKLTVKNFGPIEVAELKLKPLTVIVGPSNTGKSYFAMLLYSFCTAASGGHLPGRKGRRGWFPYGSIRHRVVGRQLPLGAVRALRSTLAGSKRNPRHRDLPPSIQKKIERGICEFWKAFAKVWQEELERCFGSPLKQLKRFGASSQPIVLEVASARSRTRIRFVAKNARLILDNCACDTTRLVYDRSSLIDDLEMWAEDDDTEALSEYSSEIHRGLIHEALRQQFDQLAKQCIYAPAGRGGILQGHRTMASSIVYEASRAGINELKIPALSGVVADFVVRLLTATTDSVRSRGAGHTSAGQIETDILGGQIVQKQGPFPEFYYQIDGGEIPINRSSSMVGELSPLVTLLRSGIRPGDMFIVEEPESHLHPQAQRMVARAMAMVVNQGINVIVTTHSDYFLEEVSNLIKAEKARDEKRLRWKISSNAILTHKKVSVWLFNKSGKRQETTRLRVSSEEGVINRDTLSVALDQYRIGSKL